MSDSAALNLIQIKSGIQVPLGFVFAEGEPNKVRPQWLPRSFFRLIGRPLLWQSARWHQLLLQFFTDGGMGSQKIAVQPV